MFLPVIIMVSEFNCEYLLNSNYISEFELK